MPHRFSHRFRTTTDGESAVALNLREPTSDICGLTRLSQIFVFLNYFRGAIAREAAWLLDRCLPKTRHPLWADLPSCFHCRGAIIGRHVSQTPRPQEGRKGACPLRAVRKSARAFGPRGAAPGAPSRRTEHHADGELAAHAGDHPRGGRRAAPAQAFHRSRRRGAGGCGRCGRGAAPSSLRVRAPRRFGDCWAGCRLWRALGLDEFWRARLGEARGEVPWEKVLELLAVNRLLDPRSELFVHEKWFPQTAMDVLLDCDFAMAEKDRL